MKTILLAAGMVLVILSSCHQPTAPIEENRVVQLLNSDNPSDQSQGLISLQKQQQKGVPIDTKIAEALLQALKREVEAFGAREEVKDIAHGGRGDELVMLATAVASNRVAGSLPLLFTLLASSPASISPAILTIFGTPAFALLREKSASGAESERRLAIRTLAIWVERPRQADDYNAELIPPLTLDERRTALLLFLKAARDQDGEVRYSSLSGLKAFPDDAEARQAIEALSASDSEGAVRLKAKRLLEAIPSKP